MDGWRDGWTDGWMDPGLNHRPCVYSRAVALRRGLAESVWTDFKTKQSVFPELSVGHDDLQIPAAAFLGGGEGLRL